MKKILFSVIVALMTVFRVFFPEWTVPYSQLPVSFSVESTSDIYLPDSGAQAVVCEYPTILQLRYQKNEANNGRLIATFEKWGSTYPVYVSDDDAKTWRFSCSVRDQLNEGFWNEWMPFLYELPADVGEFEKGTVILAATSVYGEGVTDSTITLYKSTDLGETFTAFCNVDKAGGTDWGVWEPYLIYEEETGRIFCFYSDDSDPRHSQKLVYKYSTDLVNWSEKYECVACEDPDLRPGMPVVVKMGNGQYFMVYEMGGIGSYTVYCKTSSSLDNWGSAADYGRVVSAAGKTFGSSPYAAWSPAGGECGTLIVAGSHPVKGKSKTGCDLFISFDYGKSFAPIDNPIPYYFNSTGRCGYSPSMFVSRDGSAIYYVNNPPCFDSAYKITVAKISIGE